MRHCGAGSRALPSIPPGTRLTFARRLSRETGWSQDFTRRAIAEYRRFLYLAARAGHPVTPSEEVDEVWHFHLLYTRSYWDDLCATVLGAPLHHAPTRGGRAEATKFTDWYERTLASYRQHFDAEPPAEIWPDATRRFRPLVKPTADSHWIVPKPRWWPRSGTRKRPGRMSMAAAAGAMVSGPAEAAGSGHGANPLNVLLLTGYFTFIGYHVLRWLFATPEERERRRKRGGSSGDGGGSGCGSSSSGGGDCDGSGGGGDCGGSGCGGGCGGGGD